MDQKQFMPDHSEVSYETTSPVLLIAFNRPRETSEVIAKLREVKPKRIYFSVDGPRPDKSLDAALVEETRRLQTLFDWECQVFTRFLDQNLGCGLGVSTAISWAFQNEESVIILEDDIVPATTFFRYCDELLEFYKDDEEIFSISGSNFLPEGLSTQEASFRFTNFPQIWGWATWKRAWDYYEFDVSDWRKTLGKKELRNLFNGSYISYVMWSFVIDRVSKKEIDTWDYQLCLAQWRLGALSVIPNISLTENIGFSAEATHTTSAPKYLLDPREMQFPMVYTEKAIDSKADLWTLTHPNGGNLLAAVKSLTRHLARKFTS